MSQFPIKGLTRYSVIYIYPLTSWPDDFQRQSFIPAISCFAMEENLISPMNGNIEAFSFFFTMLSFFTFLITSQRLRTQYSFRFLFSTGPVLLVLVICVDRLNSEACSIVILHQSYILQASHLHSFFILWLHLKFEFCHSIWKKAMNGENLGILDNRTQPAIPWF